MRVSVVVPTYNRGPALGQIERKRQADDVAVERDRAADVAHAEMRLEQAGGPGQPGPDRARRAEPKVALDPRHQSTTVPPAHTHTRAITHR